MARADLHVHSSSSAHPSVWFLQRLGTRESYVEPETVYTTARAQGMDFVTITDHNTIDGVLRLRDRYPQRVFTGLETTTYFPEDGAKIHLLVYGLEKEHYEQIEKVRPSIYDLRDYLKESNLAHAVAHATFSVNRKLTLEHIEKLFLLFDSFEGINGSRNRDNNDIITQVVQSLTPENIEELEHKYRIRPYSTTSWLKGIVGGTDDHSGLFIATTYTEADAQTPETFVERIRMKQTSAAGRHNDYRGLALAVYKVAYDFSKSRGKGLASSFFSSLNHLLFEKESLGFRKKLSLEKVKFANTFRETRIKTHLLELVDSLQANGAMSPDKKIDVLNEKVTHIADEFLKMFLVTLEGGMQSGDISALIRSISGSLPGVFLSIPFFTTIHALNDARELLDEMHLKYLHTQHKRKKKVLWFTDTLTDLNGVSATLCLLGKLAAERNLDLSLVASLLENEDRSNVPENTIVLPCLHTYTPSFFETYTLRVPSVLSTIKMVYEASPDEIYISTPGPVGMLGMIMSKILRVPCTAIYHTDFTRQAKQVVGEESICRFVEDMSRLFYSFADSVAVPTREYMSVLEKRGIPREKMVLFKRGIEANVFAPQKRSPEILAQRCGITDGATLMYSGRISKEKSMDFLARVYEELLKKTPDLNLVLAGDGPYFAEFKEKMKPFPRVHFLGRLRREELPTFYSSCDCFLFPSVTDTFGMVILEAQACGLPAIVSDFGGPKEIVQHGKTGFVAKANDLDDWVEKTHGVIDMITRFPELNLEMRAEARRHILSTYDWDMVLQDIFASSPKRKNGRMRQSEIPFGDLLVQDF